MDLLAISKITLALINAGAVLLVMWVWLADSKAKLNRWFSLMTAFIILWVDFAYLGTTAKNPALAVAFYRINYGMVALFLVSAFYFNVVYFLREKRPILRRFVLIIGLIFAALSFLSPFIVQSTMREPWGNETVLGWGNTLFNLYALSVALIVVGLLFKRYLTFPDEGKLKVRYFLIGAFLFALSNIILNIVVPAKSGKTVPYCFGDYSAIFFLVFAALAIVRHKLFGIKIILTQTLTVSMCAILLVLSFAIGVLWIKTLLVVVFLMSCVFGYFLIKGAKTELQQKEILRELVRERTAELRKAFDELKSRKDELEKFYNLTVGRELKMAELKQRIKEIEDRTTQ